MTDKPFLPYGRQRIDADDIAAVVDVLKGDFLTTGPAVAAFERELAKTVNSTHAVSCSSGTAGLHMAAAALDLGPGDFVAVPAITFLATANAARYVGADVVFTDVDPDSGLMRPQDLSVALDGPHGPKIKAVFPVHLAGQPADMASLASMARDRGLAIVEDACHALGSDYGEPGADHRAKVGSCRDSDMTVFSFHPVKIIAMGEGGAVTTNSDDYLARLTRFRSHGMINNPEEFSNTDMAFDTNGDVNPWYYEMPDIGYNYRASDLHCALGLSQLRKMDAFVERRRHLVKLYDGLLSALAPRVRPIARVGGCMPGWHIYPVLIDFEALGKSRAEVMNGLRQMGIGTQVHYIPVHRQPYYQALYGTIDLPDADSYYARTLTLPLFPAMKDEDVERVVEALAGVSNRTNT